jgi:hypothetical protein
MPILIILLIALIIFFIYLRYTNSKKPPEFQNKTAMKQYILGSKPYLIFTEFQQDWYVQLQKNSKIIRNVKYSSEKEYNSQGWESILNKVLIAQDMDIDHLGKIERKRIDLYEKYEHDVTARFLQSTFEFDKNPKLNSEYNNLFHELVALKKFKHNELKIIIQKECIGVSDLKSSKAFSLTSVQKMWELIDKKIILESTYWKSIMERLYEYKQTIRVVPQLETTTVFSSTTHMNSKSHEMIACEYCMENSVDPYRILSTENFNKTAAAAYLNEVENMLNLPMKFVVDDKHNLRCKQLFRQMLEQQNNNHLYTGRFTLTTHKQLDKSNMRESKTFYIMDIIDCLDD